MPSQLDAQDAAERCTNTVVVLQSRSGLPVECMKVHRQATMTYFDQVSEAAAFLKSRLGSLAPKIGIVLGSGLGAVADAIPDPILIPYSEIPHFPQSTVEGHSGRIVAGLASGIPTDRASELWCRSGVPVIILQGRVHYYEGYSPSQVTFPMRVLGALGIRAVILTNAAGGIAEGYRIGQLVALADHINLMGFNPLVGPNEPRFGFQGGPGLRQPASGLRFMDMTEAYSSSLRALAQECAGMSGIPLDEGVYLAVSGPSFETPAEIRAFRTLGATLVGMSTVPETIVARHMGIEVLGISCVTNLAAGLGSAKLNHEEVFEAGRKVEGHLVRIFERLLPRMAARAEPEP
jgi:purine-nucleoside phosphorylase